MNRQLFFQVILVSLLLAIVFLQSLILIRLPTSPQPISVHTVVLNWSRTKIEAYNVSGFNVSGYVANWTSKVDVRIVSVQVWMGNPLGILWEGDVYVTLNNRGDFNSIDQVIVHYQFDKHAESSVPHQLWFDVGSGGAGFEVEAGQTVWVWRNFVNISDKPTVAGDGQVIIYYQSL